MKVELVTTDWGTVTQRRAKKDPVAQGGWSAFVSNVNGPAIRTAYRDTVKGILPGPAALPWNVSKA